MGIKTPLVRQNGQKNEVMLCKMDVRQRLIETLSKTVPKRSAGRLYAVPHEGLPYGVENELNWCVQDHIEKEYAEFVEICGCS